MTEAGLSTRRKRLKWLGWLIVGGALGSLITIGTLGTLHATDEGTFCANCHVMDEAVITHKTSLHAKQSCNDCHTPQGWASYLPTKAFLGLSDVYYNFFGEVPDVIKAGQMSKDVIQANCIRCHGATIETVKMDAKERCIDCHRQVPHQRTTPISLRKAADV